MQRGMLGQHKEKHGAGLLFCYLIESELRIEPTCPEYALSAPSLGQVRKTKELIIQARLFGLLDRLAHNPHFLTQIHNRTVF